MFRKMPSLRTLNARYNKIQTNQIPKDLFELEELSILVRTASSSVCVAVMVSSSIAGFGAVECYIRLWLQDLSHNELTRVPDDLDNVKTLIVLNLSHNRSVLTG